MSDSTDRRMFLRLLSLGLSAPLIAACVDDPRTKNTVFNVGSESPRTVLDVAKAVAAGIPVFEVAPGGLRDRDTRRGCQRKCGAKAPCCLVVIS